MDIVFLQLVFFLTLRTLRYWKQRLERGVSSFQNDSSQHSIRNWYSLSWDHIRDFLEKSIESTLDI